MLYKNKRRTTLSCKCKNIKVAPQLQYSTRQISYCYKYKITQINCGHLISKDEKLHTLTQVSSSKALNSLFVKKASCIHRRHAGFIDALLKKI